jgi:hypothetical protein
MGTLERWLARRPLAISLVLALLVCWGLSANGVVSEQAMPFGDGEHYVLRAMTLYGFLHSGQWAHFWDTFTLPKQSIAPLHYWLFFLVPQPWAGMTSYGIIQGLTNYLLLALGTWLLCRALGRVEWAPALFLLCATQNISLDYSYYYFADVPFFAMGTVALACQVRAWREGTWRTSVLSGAAAGLMFWIKPPNAVIFTATFLLAELARAILVWHHARHGKTPANAVVSTRAFVHHIAAAATGYLPVTLLAMACGGVQSIARLVDANEVSGYLVTNLECTGLLRLFYFPLCLTFFYHTVALAVIFGAMGVAALLINREKKNQPASEPAVPPFPAPLLWPLVAAYVALGEFFSFGEVNKEMRSLLLVLPVLWLLIFWGLERRRVKHGLVFLAAAAYTLCGFSQVLFNTFETVDISTESYQLKDDWLTRLPQAQGAAVTGIAISEGLFAMIEQAVPEGGKISVGTEQMYLTSESLMWVSQRELVLRGQTSPYTFDNFLTANGEYCRRALVDSKGLLVFVNPQVQYSPKNYQAAVTLLQYSVQTWSKNGQVRVFPLNTRSNGFMGAVILPRAPLTDAQISDLIAATQAEELPPEVEFTTPVVRRLSWEQCRAIFERWLRLRLGLAS